MSEHVFFLHGHLALLILFHKIRFLMPSQLINTILLFKIRILTLSNVVDLMKDSRELHASFIETSGTFFGLQDRLAVRFSKSALYTFMLLCSQHKEKNCCVTRVQKRWMTDGLTDNYFHSQRLERLTAPISFLPFTMSTIWRAMSSPQRAWASLVLAPRWGQLMTLGCSTSARSFGGSCGREQSETQTAD